MTSKKWHELLTLLLITIVTLLLYGIVKEQQEKQEKEIKGLESLVEFYRVDIVRLETELYELKSKGNENEK